MTFRPVERQPSALPSSDQARDDYYRRTWQPHSLAEEMEEYNAAGRVGCEVVMKRSYLCLFVIEGSDTDVDVFVPDIPGCGSVGDNMPHAREMAKEVIEFCLEGAVEDGEPIPEPKMATFAEALEWFQELMNYELEGETEEDRAFNKDDLHIEMVEVEAPAAQTSAR